MSILIKAFNHLEKHGLIGIAHITSNFGMTHQEFMAKFKHMGFYYSEVKRAILYKKPTEIIIGRPAKIKLSTGKTVALIPKPVTNGIGGSWIAR